MRAPSPVNDGMGCLLFSDGTARFRVWAPNASDVQVEIDYPSGLQALDLGLEPGTGNWSADGIPATSNLTYQYRITTRPGLDNDTSQPWLRTDARAVQVQSSDPASKGYILPAFSAVQPFSTPAFENFLIYQLHVGSFTGLNDGVTNPTPTSTFVKMIPKLDYIRALGFNAIEMLPISDFRADINGGAGEGYGPSDMFASENLYASSPDRAVAELLELVDTCHSKGLAVILDVVYNHAGISNNRYWQYDGNHSGDNGIPGGIYFVHGYHTPWGEGFALWQREVRDFILDNARMYLRDYRVDGLRFDAAQAIQADALGAIVNTLRTEFPSKYLIAEYNGNDRGTSASGWHDPYGELGFSATWDLSSPSDCFDFLNGTDPLDKLLARIGSFSTPNPWHSVNYLTGSHDQIYPGDNRAGCYITQRFGGRLNGFARAKARLGWALNATLPGTPMLFMGTEGHLDGFWDPVVGTGYDHRLNWLEIGNDIGAPMQQMVGDINRLRWKHPALRSPNGLVTHIDHQNTVVAFKRYNDQGDVLLIIVNAGDGQWNTNQHGVSLSGDSGTWREIFNSQAPVYGGINTVGNPGNAIEAVNGTLWVYLPSWSVLVFAKL
ncbi:MAG TPA: alpha-amylase family glycosyl hydrolase [Nitrospira sp.]|nr:alpha-amylase family glycosyl hydrolase [Nitrospira sp.]